MIIVHACTMIIVHACRLIRLFAFMYQVMETASDRPSGLNIAGLTTALGQNSQVVFLMLSHLNRICRALPALGICEERRYSSSQMCIVLFPQVRADRQRMQRDRSRTVKQKKPRTTRTEAYGKTNDRRKVCRRTLWPFVRTLVCCVRLKLVHTF